MATVAEALSTAIHHHSAGNLSQAESIYRQILTSEPQNAAALHLLGVIAYQVGRNELAVDLIGRSLAVNPDSHEAVGNMANALKTLGRVDEAIAHYERAIGMCPTFRDALYNLGVTLEDAGRLDEAVAMYRRAISQSPGYVPSRYNLGNVLKALGRLDEAVATYREALALDPGHVDALNNLGSCLTELARPDEAIVCFRVALAAAPDFAVAHANLANALSLWGGARKDMAALDEAEASYRRAIALHPDHPDAHVGLGTLYYRRGKPAQAMEWFEAALALKPDMPEAYNNIGLALKMMGEIDRAIASYDRAIAVKPDMAEAHMARGMALLNVGRVAEGLDEVEWRWGTLDFIRARRTFDRPPWDGVADPTGKTILIWGEQGVGDQILWAAFVPEIVERAGRCIVECTAKLVPLFARSFPRAEVRAIDTTADAVRADFDYHLPMGSLFRALDATAPRDKTFLFPDPERVAFWRRRLEALGEGPYVGLTWTSGSSVDSVQMHSYAQVDDWGASFAGTKGVFVNLQYGDREADLRKARQEYGVVLHAFKDIDLFDDLHDAAALVAALDAVVSVMTAVVGIAAGVGTPTWRLTWRRDSNNNVLYDPAGPAVKILYRDTGETWEAAYREIASRLAAWPSPPLHP